MPGRHRSVQEIRVSNGPSQPLRGQAILSLYSEGLGDSSVLLPKRRISHIEAARINTFKWPSPIRWTREGAHAATVTRWMPMNSKGTGSRP